MHKIIKTPSIPQFMFVTDEDNMELYILHTNPYSLIWVHQTTPAQLYIVDGTVDVQILKKAADFYRERATNNLDKN